MCLFIRICLLLCIHLYYCSLRILWWFRFNQMPWRNQCYSYHAIFLPSVPTHGTECPKSYRKSVLHLLKYTANLYLSRCSTDLRYILGHSVLISHGNFVHAFFCGICVFRGSDPDPNQVFLDFGIRIISSRIRNSHCKGYLCMCRVSGRIV